MLPYLLELHGHKCYHCKIPLVHKRTLRNITKLTPNTVSWIDNNGHPQQCRWATVDHLLRICEGGNNHIDNLVPACAGCNSHRHDTPKNTPCPKCGVLKKEKYLVCHHCTKLDKRAKYLEEHGWTKLYKVKLWDIWLDPVDVVKHVNFPGYKFNVRPVEDDPESDYYEHAFIQVEYVEPDVMTGVPETQRGRIWVIEPNWGITQIVQTCFKALLTSLEHRGREHFSYQGKAVLMPHFDMEQLLKISPDAAKGDPKVFRN
jgi:hypothetical protein